MDCQSASLKTITIAGLIVGISTTGAKALASSPWLDSIAYSQSQTRSSLASTNFQCTQWERFGLALWFLYQRCSPACTFSVWCGSSGTRYRDHPSTCQVSIWSHWASTPDQLWLAHPGYPCHLDLSSQCHCHVSCLDSGSDFDLSLSSPNLHFHLVLYHVPTPSL